VPSARQIGSRQHRAGIRMICERDGPATDLWVKQPAVVVADKPQSVASPSRSKNPMRAHGIGLLASWLDLVEGHPRL